MTLAKQQASFCQAIFSFVQADEQNTNAIVGEVGSAKLNRALSIYQNNLLANAQRALAISYPSVEKILGAKLFGELTTAFLQAEAKKDYDWGEWGQGFPLWLSQHSQLEQAKLISDLANFDWIYHQVERTQDVVFDLSSLELLNQVDASQLSFCLAPGLTTLSSEFPLLMVKEQIVANQTSQTINLPANADDSDFECLNYFVIWRAQFKAEYQQITFAEYQWLQMLKNATSIAQALDLLSENNQLSCECSFTDWLAKAIQTKQLFAIRRLYEDS